MPPPVPVFIPPRPPFSLPVGARLTFISPPAPAASRLPANGFLRPLRSSSKDDHQVSPTATSFAARGIANVASKDRRMSDLTNYRRELAVLETRIPQIQHNPPTASPNPHIAPWMNHNGSSTPSSTMPTSFYNDSSDNLSLASQLSPGHPPPNHRQVAASHDSPDASYFDGRRPSAASILTASSQGSKTSVSRGGLRKLQGFFGEEFPGRDSSESSLPTSLVGRDQRSRSYSHSRPTHRDRNYSNATDHTRDGSPSSSRPRTPVPAPEVVPFLYQDNTVRPPCASLSHRPSYSYPPLAWSAIDSFLSNLPPLSCFASFPDPDASPEAFLLARVDWLTSFE